MTHLTVGGAISLGSQALGREAWLTAVGFLVAALRRALGWPAAAVLWFLLLRGALAGLRAAPLSVQGPLGGLLLVASQPRVWALVAGLWLAGALLSLALRLAWLAGALPTLAAALGASPDPTPRFADGVAHVLPRLVPVAALVLLMELGGGGFAAGLVLGALRITGVALGTGPAWLAAPVALALTLAVAVPLALSLVGDAALVRAAVRGEGPAEALARAVERFVRRPSAFLLAAIVFGLLGLVTAAALQAVGTVSTGFAASVSPLVLSGPRLMLGALGATVAAALELWWLATLTALSTHEG